MFSPVRRANLPIEIGDRPSQRVEIVGQRGGEERERDVDVGVVEVVDRADCNEAQADLRKRRQSARSNSHQAIGPAVDADQTIERMGMPGPMPSHIAIEPISL